jgi:hypothetical protein
MYLSKNEPETLMQKYPSHTNMSGKRSIYATAELSLVLESLKQSVRFRHGSSLSSYRGSLK